MTSLQEFIEQQNQQREEVSRRRQEQKPERKVQVATFKSNVFTSVSGTATDQYITYAPDATNTPVNTYDALSQSGSALEFTAPLSRFYDYTSRVYLSSLSDPADLVDDATVIEAQLAADFLIKMYKVDSSGTESLISTGRSVTDGAATVNYPGLTVASRKENLQASDFTGVIYLEAGEKLRAKLDYSTFGYAERITEVGCSIRPFYSGFTGYIGSSTIYPVPVQEVQNTSGVNVDVWEDPPRTFPSGGAFPTYSSGTDTDHLLFVQGHILTLGAGNGGFTGSTTFNTFTGDFDFFMRINEIGADY